MFITWQGSYTSGNSVLDTQHRRLIDMVGDLHQTVTAEKSPDTQLARMAEIIDYLKMHSTFELQLLPQSNKTKRISLIEEFERIHGLFHDMLKRTEQSGTGFHEKDLDDLRDILLAHIVDEAGLFSK